jgi:hypothetical protein
MSELAQPRAPELLRVLEPLRALELLKALAPLKVLVPPKALALLRVPEPPRAPELLKALVLLARQPRAVHPRAHLLVAPTLRLPTLRRRIRWWTLKPMV